MLRYPRWGATRTCLAAELQELLNYHLLQLEMGYVSRDDNEIFQSLHLDRRTQRAVYEMMSWEWPEDEEWMRDALEAILLGNGSIEFLPWDTT